MPHPPLDREKNVLRVEVRNDGSSRFRVIKTISGTGAEPARQAVRGILRTGGDAWVGQMLHAAGQRGYGVLEAGLVDGVADDYQMVFAGVSADFVDLPGMAKVRTSFGFPGGLAQQLDVLKSLLVSHQAPGQPALDHEEEMEFLFAPGIAILALPPTLTITDAMLTYTAAYVRTDHGVLVRRHLRYLPGDSGCMPADLRRLLPLIERIQADLRRGIAVRG